MKTQLKIYGNTYEVKINAKDIRNLKASTKATVITTRWLETRLWEASHEHSGLTYNEITESASNLHNYNVAQESNL